MSPDDTIRLACAAVVWAALLGIAWLRVRKAEGLDEPMPDETPEQVTGWWQ